VALLLTLHDVNCLQSCTGPPPLGPPWATTNR